MVTMQGPNLRRLIVERTSQILLSGPGGGIGGVIAAIMKTGNLVAAVREATAWVMLAIEAVRQAPDSTWTDEEVIAGEILRRIEENRKKAKKKSGNRS